ncbi:hypothetical protein NDU88_002276 [Pleurodeles waltl]|uniref:Uncharacterized protein n=1 Tax=Pleurodeles waltl TaxID=8319 RepID=A0AAV7UV38_PLEWA|nr:hypothetical protein NDU88_002276 [Pleurodeles waltl]
MDYRVIGPKGRGRLMLVVAPAQFRALWRHRIQQTSTTSSPISAPLSCLLALRPRRLPPRGARHSPRAQRLTSSPRQASAMLNCSKSLAPSSSPRLGCLLSSTAASSDSGSRDASALSRAQARAPLRSRFRPSPIRVYGDARHRWQVRWRAAVHSAPGSP